MFTARVMKCELPGGRAAIGCIVKRDYSLELARAPRPRDEAPPLVDEPVFVDPLTCEELLHDLDALVFLHPGVDVVVLGHVRPQRAVEQLDAVITIGPHQKRLRVFGDRVVERDGRGAIQLSTPAPFDAMPLTYRRAFGGGGFGGASAVPYPRNPIGVGYPLQLREAPALERRCLPNFEEPSDPLTVERLLALDPTRWLDAPLPAGTTCLMPFTFPRAALLYDVDPEDALRVVAEERPDLRAEDFAERGRPVRADPSAASSASSGLRCLPLRGDEPLVLEHLHPDSRLVASRLPDARVTVTFRLTATRWEMAPAELRKVVLAPDERRMTLTYAATIPVAEEVLSAGIDDVRVDVVWA